MGCAFGRALIRALIRALNRDLSGGAGFPSDGSVRRVVSTASMSMFAASINTMIARSAFCGEPAITASSAARCSGSDDAGPSGREVEISKLARSNQFHCSSRRCRRGRS